ncbi:MAG TPA: CBS domain-containing protein, partial [Opitutus sp.]|nr:CBS domain-containing protein [Opitutus sp.]
SAGYLFGTAVNVFWPTGAADPQAFALVGMGAFLSAATYAPVMAVIMLFEMTLSYDIILPLLLSAVVAYYTAKGVQGESLYSESLRRKAAETPQATLPLGTVRDLMKQNPPVVPTTAHFAEIARMFLSVRVNNIYVTNPDGRFMGAVSLHDIKPYLGDADLAGLVIANDIMREDFPRIRPEQSLSDALGAFLGQTVERLPVIENDGRLLGSLSKSDLLLALVEKRQKPTA